MTNNRAEEKYQEWMQDTYFSAEMRAELLALTDKKEIEDRFYCDLEFGTGGMRGLLGAGTNRINIYVIRRLAQGLADVLEQEGSKAKGVVIAHDSRHFSREFSLETALVLAANGIKAYLFDRLRPTPELSFAVRYLKTAAGVMITASHNPREYNGFKVYWADGSQISPQKAGEIVACLDRRRDWHIPSATEEEAGEKGLLTTVGEEVDRAYLAEVKAQFLNAPLIREKGGNLKIVYTPLHGTGRDLVLRTMAELGFRHTLIVKEQAEPDGDFPSVKVPNPEEDEAFALALSLARETGAHLAVATDPDADRVGVFCRKKDGAYRRFTGNEIGVLLGYYLFSIRREKGLLPADGCMVKSVVSTALAAKVAADFGVSLIDVPVGFKFIGEKIKEMEESGKGAFLWGFEESLGYLTGTYTRDKDAVLATALVSEAALYYDTLYGKTLDDVMEEIYRLYGYFLDHQVAFTLKGIDGKERIAALMKALREDRRTIVGGLAITERTDYLSGRSLAGEKEETVDFPRVDIFRYSLAGGGFIMARPSGTEPKIRFYFCIAGADREEAKKNLAQVQADFFTPFAALLK